VKQESLFTYAFISEKEGYGIYPTLKLMQQGQRIRAFATGYENIAAFTVAELGEMLPHKIYGETDWEIYLERGDDNYIIGYINEAKNGERLDDVCFNDKTEADARAKMLIYLIENKLIKI